MYQIGDSFLYGREGVCKITDIVTRQIKGEDKQYYVLEPQDQHIKIFIPVDNNQAVSKMRRVLSKEDIYKLIKAMPDNETIWIEDKNVRKQKYNNIIINGDHEQLVKLIKTLYLHREEKLKSGKNFHVQDQQFLDTCEKILYDEFSTVLNIKPDQVIPFIINTINEENSDV
ncbi:CarD family transcriptional regulator [uncultured Thomasclavelia sp.]|uniref:CarD family transcriptional regulator n=1 Tax=uncultured Thomasclavelia sp. TaxID=3025759 RepID=UPI0025E35365|nr:CarD family transcriptional regulator [uncultured Thomasclavelia sp.]